MSKEKEITKKDLEDEIAMCKHLSALLYKKPSERTKKESDEILEAYEESIGCLIANDISETKICIERYYTD